MNFDAKAYTAALDELGRQCGSDAELANVMVDSVKIASELSPEARAELAVLADAAANCGRRLAVLASALRRLDLAIRE